MLGVLKRRWKPKRASGGRRGVGQGKLEQAVPGDGVDKARAAASPRQVHPLCDDKSQLLAYESKTGPSSPVPTPPPLPPLPIYPLAPNICVEDGRIEFIKPPPDSVTLTVTRAQQTCGPNEKSDVAKESLEARVLLLEKALEAEQRNGQRERLAVTRLERQLARREVLQRDVDRERRLRLDTEVRLRESTGEADRCRARLAALQREFARMEDTVRNVLQYKTQSEQLKQEKTALTIAYETQIRSLRNKVQRLSRENEALRRKLQTLERSEATGPCAVLQEQLKVLEAHNRSLLVNTEMQRREYEKCLDNVAAQVVRALCAQKWLLERIGMLENRLAELDASEYLQQSWQQLDTNPGALHLCSSDMNLVLGEAPDTPLTSAATTTTSSSDEQCALIRGPLGDFGETAALSGLEPLFWLPLQRPRPRSLNLQVHNNSPSTSFTKCQHKQTSSVIMHNGKNSTGAEDEGSESPESGNRDEGYSTMSSDIQGETVRSGEAASSLVTSEPLRRGLEDVKEENDTVILPAESASAIVVDNRLLVMEDACDPDVLYIPLGLPVGLSTTNPRHSFPPSRDLLPYQHIMRSFSDSHLCLKLTAGLGVTSCQRQHSSFSFSSTASSSPSVLLLDVITSGSGNSPHSRAHPLRRTRATTSLLTTALNDQETVDEEDDDAHSNTGSWCSVVEGCWWDADYIQHWLRLDDTRSALQQQHRDMMELEYDQAELEDWSMSLSSEDITSSLSSADSWTLLWRRSGPVVETPNQMCGVLPIIQENNALELEEDSNECLWNNASYLLDKPSVLDGENGDHSGTNITSERTGWPYGSNVGVSASYSLASPGGSWSSTGTNSEECCHSYDCAYNGCADGAYENSSKRSSAAMSGCSDDAASTESPAVGTDFTRDFYRLVKFESTKSLASTSSRSLINGVSVSDIGGSLSRKPGSEQVPMTLVMQSQDREEALQSVLNFIAEQQQYCVSREKDDLVKDEGEQKGTSVGSCSNSSRTTSDGQSNGESISDGNKIKDLEATSDEVHESKELQFASNSPEFSDSHGSELAQNLSNCVSSESENADNPVKLDKCEQQIHSIIEVNTKANLYLLVDDNSVAKEKCTEVLRNVQNSKSQDPGINLKTERQFLKHVCIGTEDDINTTIFSNSDISSKGFGYSDDARCDEKNNNSDESTFVLAGSCESVCQERPLHRGVGVLVTVIEEDDQQPASLDSSFCRDMTESFTSTLSSPDTVVCSAQQTQQASESSAVLQEFSEDLGAAVVISDGPPHSRAASFIERTSSKDVIEELNRMIRKGDEAPDIGNGEVAGMAAPRLDLACCCPTGWVHVEREIDFTDPKARANLLDVMLASSGSSGNSSASSSPTNSESGDEPVDYQHLHRLHRFRRQKKASATREQLGVLRYSANNPRPSIIGRDDFFVRYGEKEREAVASFDFLEEMSTTSVSGASSCDTLGSRNIHPPLPICVNSTTPSSDDSDDKTGEQISISDSCLASDSSSPVSLDNHDELSLV